MRECRDRQPGLLRNPDGYRRDMSEPPVDPEEIHADDVDPEDVESVPEELPIPDDADQRDVVLEDDPDAQEPPD